MRSAFIALYMVHGAYVPQETYDWGRSLCQRMREGGTVKIALRLPIHLLAISEHGSFNGAAASMGRSPAALSNSIVQLERRLVLPPAVTCCALANFRTIS